MNDSFIELSSENSRFDSENNPNVINKTDNTLNTAVLPVINEKGESNAENTGKRDSTSRQLNFDDTVNEVVNKKEPDRPKISLFSKIQSSETTKKTRSDIKSVDSLIAPLDGLAVKRTNSAPVNSTEPKLCTELQTPKLKSSQYDGSSKAPTSNADGEETFQVPPTTTMRRAQTSSQHRTLLSSASQSRKCRSELENEFRSQKVLFRTPSAVSRPALKVMSHLGLDDSLNCYQSSPTLKLLSPVKEEQKKTKPPLSEPSADALRSNDIDDKTDAAKSVTSSTSNEPKSITINGKDFLIQNKIGQGGSSTVFLVEHKETKVQCALKVSCSICRRGPMANCHWQW